MFGRNFRSAEGFSAASVPAALIPAASSVTYLDAVPPLISISWSFLSRSSNLLDKGFYRLFAEQLACLQSPFSLQKNYSIY